MNPQQPEQPAKLQFDAEQWQRDIHTFAETTNQALHAIVAQLSNSCCNGQMYSTNQDSSETTGLRRTANQTHEPNSISSMASSDVGEDDRLSKIKSKLAQRIARSR